MRSLRHIACAAVLLACAACTLPAQLAWVLLPEGTVPAVFANLRGIDYPVQEELARLEQRGDWPAILKLADDGLAKDPDQFDWQTIRAHALTRLGRWSEAEGAFRMLLQREPHDLDTWLHLAHTQRMDGRRAQAIVTLQRALQVSRESPAVFAGLGDLYREAGDAARARGAYGEALRLAPDFAPAVAGLAQLR